ncbi:MAG: DUF488 domain-containing protein [Proteobacteria bacterium]|nr:DUF488 domain-containing protein [Pseudomonadota bacterium]
MEINIKRVYEPWSKQDGFRVLVDRLWPRGIAKDKAHIDLWHKDIAPSNELRTWFHHEVVNWPEFQRRYRDELKAMPEIVAAFCAQLAGKKKVTLLYGAKDEERNQAVVLRAFLCAGLSQ